MGVVAFLDAEQLARGIAAGECETLKIDEGRSLRALCECR
jgi:hypothetical protein